MTPILHSFDLTSQATNDNPFPVFARMRETGPVVWTRLPMMGRCWAVTTYAAVKDVLKDPRHFTRDLKNAGARYPAWMTWLTPGIFRTLMQNMLGYDEPDHRRLRSLVEEAFVRRNVQQMHGRIEELTDELLDQLTERRERSGGQVDLLEHFARALPLAVICELLGLPSEDRPQFMYWARGLTTVKSAWGIFRVVSGLRKLARYLKAEIEERRSNPKEGLVSELVSVGEEGQRLSEDELLAMLFLLLLAGHETTTHLISGGIWTLLRHPEQKADLLADWSLGGTAVEEILRFHSPVQLSKPRFVAQDIEFYGVPMKRGQYVLPILAAANSDPAQFENPERFDIRRHPNPHLSFGTGIHVCLGLKLAREETQVALRRLFTRFPELRIAEPAESKASKRWAGRIGMRALRQLPVTW